MTQEREFHGTERIARDVRSSLTELVTQFVWHGFSDPEKIHVIRALNRTDLGEHLVALLRQTNEVRQIDGFRSQFGNDLKGKALKTYIAKELGEGENPEPHYSATNYWFHVLDDMRKSAFVVPSGKAKIEGNVELLIQLGAAYPASVSISTLPRYYSNSSATLTRRLYRQDVVETYSIEGVEVASLTSKGYTLAKIVSAHATVYCGIEAVEAVKAGTAHV